MFLLVYNEPMPLRLDPPQFERLVLLESYEYYDRPLLFSCVEESTGRLFLAVLVNEHITIEEWLYVETSRHRLIDIRSGLISLHDAFTKSENGYVFRALIDKLRYGNERFEISPSLELQVNQVPAQGERLNIQEPLPLLPQTPSQTMMIPGTSLVPMFPSESIIHTRMDYAWPTSLAAEAAPDNLPALQPSVNFYFDNVISQNEISVLTEESRRLERECHLMLLNGAGTSFAGFLRENLSTYSKRTFTRSLKVNTIDEIKVALSTMLSVAPTYPPDEVIAMGRRYYMGVAVLSEVLGMTFPNLYMAKNKSTEFGVLLINFMTSQSLPKIKMYSDFISRSFEAWNFVSGRFREREINYDADRQFWYLDNFCTWIYEKASRGHLHE
jgi:hypothetical protein